MSKRTILLTVVGALVVFVVAVAANYKYNRNDTANQQVDTTPKQGEKKDAEKGKVIEGFPKELVLNSNGTVTESYSIPYGESTEQFTVNFETSKSIAAEYEAYMTFLEKNGYQIINKNLEANIGNIYATNTKADVNFVASRMAEAKSTSVVVTYLKKQ